MPFKLAIKLLIYIRMRIMIRVKKKKKFPLMRSFLFFIRKIVGLGDLMLGRLKGNELSKGDEP